MKTLIALILLFPISLFSEKVLIFTYAYNRPEFIKIQHDTFKKHLKDEYEFVVFSDAPTPRLQHKIEKQCQTLGLKCIRVPQEIHNRPYLPRASKHEYQSPSVRNCNVVQYSLDQLGFSHNGLLALVDSDMFLVKDFSITQYMKGYNLAGLHHNRNQNGRSVEYLWIGLVFMDLKTMNNPTSISFNCGLVDGVPTDTGGSTHYYLRDNPNMRVQNLPQFSAPYCNRKECKKEHTSPCPLSTFNLIQVGFKQRERAFLQTPSVNSEFYIGDTFLHLKAGSNWNKAPINILRQKNKALKALIAT
ncbi:MAG: hypothetical protein P0S95_01995 [Rhabdochlamydiaceae bacterium]|nr:hypothetical protein [Candidatus Amphrikana amoebophyrae]